MGLREHEFDIAPELLAALARGTPGPLLDRAMVHGVNVAEAAATLRESEQNERLRENASAVEGQVEAALHGVEAAIGRVRDRGLVDVGNVGGGMPSGTDHLGNVGIKSVGPGRRVGRIPIGKHGWIRGSTVHDFLLGLRLTGDGRASAGKPRERPEPLTEEDRARIDLKERINAAYHDRVAAESEVDHLLRTEVDITLGGGSDEQLADVRDRLQAAQSRRDRTQSVEGQLRYELSQVRLDAPDSDKPALGIDNRVSAFLLYQRLQSLGGLGVREHSEQGRTVSKVPHILRAVDPAPDSNSRIDLSDSISNWRLWLIDPPPDSPL